MTGKTHAICGTVTMAAIAVIHTEGLQIADYNYIPMVGLLTAGAGSYFPDIDIPRSRLGTKFRFISKHLTHRGITHTLLGPAVLFALMLYVASIGIPIVPELLMGFIVGWITHVVADMFNKKGVPILWPLTRQHVHIATFLTGTWHEAVFIILWIGVSILWVYTRLK